MKALSLKQPWASLVAIGAKGIETRDWCSEYRGPLAIHASKKFDTADFMLALTPVFREALAAGGIAHPRDLPTGAIVATAHVLDVRRFSAANEGGTPLPLRVWRMSAQPHELAFGDFTAERFGWILGGVQQCTPPIMCRGMLGLWEVPADLRSRLTLRAA